MGSKASKNYDQQEKALKNNEISFNLNLYFIGENISFLYEDLLEKKKTSNLIFSFWEYFYFPGNYNEQLEKNKDEFLKHQSEFQKRRIEDKKNVGNIFYEVILVNLPKKDDNKIIEIFNIFGKEFDVYCPFIIFLFDEEETNSENQIRNLLLNSDDSDNEYYISPLKVFSFKLDKNINENFPLFKRLYRICSYYNELGDQFIIWRKENDEPFPYDLISANFPIYINIFCLGKTGAGKSTFLNKFFNEKRSKEGGTGKSCTTKIIRYGLDGVPIRVYDIPGFEDENTVEMVYNKLKETKEEMNNDRDRIHIILYFINYSGETLFYELENKIINVIKENNTNIKIIFVLTHCKTNPYVLNKGKGAINKLKKNIEKIINNISSNFGNQYSTETNYFQKDSIIQDNLVLANFVKDVENDIPEFGFDKIINSIYNILTNQNNSKILQEIRESLMYAIVNKIPISKELDKKIEENLSKSYLLQQTTFASQKEQIIKKAEKEYNNMFSIGKTIMAIFPFVVDLKLCAVKYQKYSFKKKLEKIFGFTLTEETTKGDEDKNFKQINTNYLEKKEKAEDKMKKEKEMSEISKDIKNNEVSSGWILVNGVVNYVSVLCLFGGPVSMAIGGAGIIGTQIVSFQQYKKDCFQFFEQYKKHFEENKYLSLFNFITSLLLGIQYIENYILICQIKEENQNNDQDAPNPEEIKETIKETFRDEYKSIQLKNNIKNENFPSIPVLE